MGIQLSKRMSALASLVTEGSRLADIGTDHGYIPIALVAERPESRQHLPGMWEKDLCQGPESIFIVRDWIHI